MATSTTSNHAAVELFYQHRTQLQRYIQSRLNNRDDAEDLTQDVFLRLLEYPGEIRKESAGGLAFSIAANVINDYLRHAYVKTAAHNNIALTRTEATNDTEETVIGNDMRRLEKRSLCNMPPQRRLIYTLRIHEGKTTREIAEQLNISTRTAENHFYIGIRQMRASFAEAI